MISAAVAQDMHKASLVTNFFWIDDVYITGLLMERVRKKLKVKNIRVQLYWKAVVKGHGATGVYGNLINSKLREKLWQWSLQNLTESERSQLNL